MPGSLRILFLSHYATPHIGGIETTVEGLSRELRRRGHDVVQIASAAEVAERAEAETDGVIRLRAWNGLERHFGVPYPLFTPRLVAELRERIGWADVVHAHGFLYMPSVVGLRLARGSGAAARVLTEHVGHVAYSSPLLNRVEAAAIASVGRYCVRMAQAVIVLNERIRSEVLRLGASGPVRIITSGVDPESFRPARPGEKAALRQELGWDERPRVLLVGRLVEKKGVELAIAAARAAHGGFELVIAGPGRSPDPGPSVQVMGPMPKEHVARLYRAADALLLPSRGEGLPVSLIEALASGLPSFVRSDPAYIRYAEEAGPALTLLEPDPAKIAAALSAFLSSPSARAAAADQASRYARRRFSWEVAATAHEAVYRSLLEARERP